jgi:hypothetical protein
MIPVDKIVKNDLFYTIEKVIQFIFWLIITRYIVLKLTPIR